MERKYINGLKEKGDFTMKVIVKYVNMKQSHTFAVIMHSSGTIFPRTLFFIRH